MQASPDGQSINLVEYDRHFLEDSWRWLNDPETKRLTVTPTFSRADQERFFASLPRADYRIWGVALADETRIGAAGLKRIRPKIAEYWGYIGDPNFRGKGFGAQMLALVEHEARKMGLESLELTVSHENVIARHVYRRQGYVVIDSNDETLEMLKELRDNL